MALHSIGNGRRRDSFPDQGGGFLHSKSRRGEFANMWDSFRVKQVFISTCRRFRLKSIEEDFIAVLIEGRRRRRRRRRRRESGAA